MKVLSNEQFHFDLAFLHDWAYNPQRLLTEHEEALLTRTRELLQQADKVIVLLGGKAGRLGECIVGTGLLEAILQAIIAIGKVGLPIQIVVEPSCLELFSAQQYQAKYWSTITVTSSDKAELEEYLQQGDNCTILILDFHGAHDGLPYLEHRQLTKSNHQIATFAQLFRVGLRSYAQRGQDRRYADFIENLFSLPAKTIPGQYAQPHIMLSQQDRLSYHELSSQCTLDPQALQLICFFQSVVPAKCYERWDEVMELLCQYFAEHFPAQKLDFLLACGPDHSLPAGIRKADIEEWLADFTGINNNARVIIRETETLNELSILTQNAMLALSNDTGPGHIAGALGIHTITPFLPGNIYAKHVWSSTPWHHGVTLEPNPYTQQQLEAAVIWDNTTIINSIPPEHLTTTIIEYLPTRLQLAQIQQPKTELTCH